MFSLLWVGSIIATLVIADKKRFNVAGYLFLSLILGPIAVIIVLLSRPRAGVALKSGGVFTLQDAKQHLLEMKRSLKYLKEKSDLLEARLSQLSGEKPVSASESAKPVPLQKAADKKAIESSTSEGFEQVFGKYWLNRIGVVLFVMGIGLFISYTFQYLNAFAKVAIGYAFSAAFFIWGRALEKNKKYQKIAWGILGGAWGLLYLSTYAMHYIPATKVISSSMLEVLLLAGVSIAAVYYNLKYKSWVVTAMTFILAFIPAGLGGMDYSSVVYFSLLVGSVAYLAYRMNWHAFLILGIIGSYFTHFCWVDPKLFFKTSYFGGNLDLRIYQFQIMFGILAISWAIYSAVFFLMKKKTEDERKLLVTGQLINAGLFTFMGLHEIGRVQSRWTLSWDEKFWFLFALSGVYFLFAYLYKKIKQSKMIVLNTTIAFTLVAMAIFLKVPKLSVAFYWILEMAMLFVIGVYYKEKIYRVFAALMSVFITLRLFFVDFFSHVKYAVAGVSVQHDILIFCFAAMCFYVLGAVVGKKQFSKVLMKDEKDLYFWAFPILGTVLLAFLFEDEIASRWVSLSWTLLGTGLISVGFFLKNRVFRLNALCVLSIAAMRVIFVDMSGVNTIYKISAFTVLGALLLGISMIYSKYKVKNEA